jgi:hypothetical protein
VGFLVTVAVLVSAPPSGGAQARLGEARAAIVKAERARGAEVVEDARSLVQSGWTAEANLAFFAEAAARVQEGHRALARVELERAEEAFAAAERIYSEHAALPGVRIEHAEAAKWHGVAWFELKNKQQAADAWGRALMLDPKVELTEAMVRPEVVRAFADDKASRTATELKRNTPVGSRLPPDAPLPPPGASEVGRILSQLRLEEAVVVAVAIDRGVLTYAATRVDDGCATPTVISTRAEDLVRKVHEAPCREREPVTVYEVPEIAHPRPAPTLAKGGKLPSDHRTSMLRRPWLWVGVVGAIGVGVVLGVTLWPRQASYSAGLDYHAFAIGAR